MEIAMQSDFFFAYIPFFFGIERVRPMYARPATNVKFSNKTREIILTANLFHPKRFATAAHTPVIIASDGFR